VLVTDAFGGTGGIAQYTRDFIAALASYHDTETVTVVPRLITREPQPLPPRVNQLSEAASGKIPFALTAMRAARRETFDWIVCAHINLLPAAVLAATISGGRIILLTYGIEVWSRRNFLSRSLLRRVFGFIAISEITIDRMRVWADIPPHRSFLIPNAIDLSRYTPGRKNDALTSRWSLSEKRVLLTVGRMDAAEQAKGFDEILDVLPSLRKEMPDIAYLAVGDGSDRARLEEKASKLGLQDVVFFPGYVDEADKLEYYRIADVFVMPSRLEGFGYVFLEALAVGKPVIASKVDGSREAVRMGAWGALVDPASPAELLEAIREALLHPRVPPKSELDYFSTSEFERRCHEALDTLERSGATGEHRPTRGAPGGQSALARGVQRSIEQNRTAAENPEHSKARTYDHHP
jgi:glycosyltransferase involved in cell wall biosynthesis